MAINPGYMGLCTIDGIKIRVTDFSVNVVQEVEFYDHIIGLRDSFPTAFGTKGDTGAPNPALGDVNIQKYTWRPGVKICSGGISFPATCNNLQKTFDLARSADDFTLEFSYSCDDVLRTFNFCKLNSYAFSITAGDILTITLDVMGRFMVEETGSILYDEAEKLITWDNVTVNSASGSPVQAFDFSVSNNCMPIYTAGANVSEELFPKKIRVGMQEMTGTIVYYVKGIPYEDLDAATGFETINIIIDGSCGCADFNETLCLIYKPIERNSNIGALLHTLPFIGVGRALGSINV